MKCHDVSISSLSYDMNSRGHRYLAATLGLIATFCGYHTHCDSACLQSRLSALRSALVNASNVLLCAVIAFVTLSHPPGVFHVILNSFLCGLGYKRGLNVQAGLGHFSLCTLWCTTYQWSKSGLILSFSTYKYSSKQTWQKYRARKIL